MIRIHIQSRKEVVMNWNQIIAITVLGIAALMLGCKPNATEGILLADFFVWDHQMKTAIALAIGAVIIYFIKGKKF